MRTMHLFAGAGGGLLADLILGHEPTVAVEWDAHACRVLRERAQDGWFPDLHVHAGDVREFDPSPWAGRVDQIAAGFPCQDISIAGRGAGRGAGLAGTRSGLVSEVFRAIDSVRPGLVFLENSPHIRTRGRDVVIGELVARGYAWRDGILAASDVGAGHQRNRWWLLAANADGMRQLQQKRRQQEEWQRSGYGTALDANPVRGKRKTGVGQQGGPRTKERPDAALSDSTPSDSLCTGLAQLGRCHADGSGQVTTADGDETHAANRLRQRLQSAVQRGGLSAADAAAVEAAARYVGAYDWSPPDAGVCRVVDGLASRVDRIKCAGNGQVPLQAAAAWLMLSKP